MQCSGKRPPDRGATFGQNDVITDFCEVEAKTTNKESFALRLSDWRKLRKKCASNKLPIMVIDFESSKDTLVTMTYEDFQFLVEGFRGDLDNS